MLTRRNAIALASAVLAAVAVPTSAQGKQSEVLRISTSRDLPSDLPISEAAQWHALLNGEAVCAQCFFADSAAGIVGLFARDHSGHFYMAGASYRSAVDTTKYGPATEIRHGKVELLPPSTECDCGRLK